MTNSRPTAHNRRALIVRLGASAATLLTLTRVPPAAAPASAITSPLNPCNGGTDNG